ncbi:hypothetical protein ANTQUA_LOCUS3169 [Anthophora quadrimaculata]
MPPIITPLSPLTGTISAKMTLEAQKVQQARLAFPLKKPNEIEPSSDNSAASACSPNRQSLMLENGRARPRVGWGPFFDA